MVTKPTLDGNDTNKELNLHVKIQKLIDSFTDLKGKYATLKEDYERTLTSNIELEDTNTQLMNEKAHFEQKIEQLNEELHNKTAEINKLREANSELDILTKDAASKIDDILSQCDLDA